MKHPNPHERFAACLALARRIVAAHRAEAPAGCDPQMTEVWAAAAAAVAGAAVTAGVGAYSSSQNAKTIANAQGKRPPLVPYTAPGIDTGLTQWEQLYNTKWPNIEGDLNAINSGTATDYQQQMLATDPTLLSSINQNAAGTDSVRQTAGTLSTQAQQLASGQIPADVAAQVQRSDAYHALAGGYGPDSGMGHALTARDLGLTSLNLINQGAQLGQTSANLYGVAQNRDQTAYNYAKELNPGYITDSSLLPTPSSLLARADSNAVFANQEANANQQINYQNALSQATASTYNPALAGVSSLAGSAGNLLTNPTLQNYFTGGSGSGYGGSGYDAINETAASGNLGNGLIDFSNVYG